MAQDWRFCTRLFNLSQSSLANYAGREIEKDERQKEENLSWQTKRPADVVLPSDTTGFHSNPAGQ